MERKREKNMLNTIVFVVVARSIFKLLTWLVTFSNGLVCVHYFRLGVVFIYYNLNYLILRWKKDMQSQINELVVFNITNYFL